MAIPETLLHGHTFTTATDAESVVLDQHHDGTPTLYALLMQARQSRGMLPADKRAGWDAMVDHLLDLGLSVTSYDQTIDLLHHEMFPPAQGAYVPMPKRPSRRGQAMPPQRPWHRAGYRNWQEIVDALRRLGYTGSVSLAARDLWPILEERLRYVSGDDLAA